MGSFLGNYKYILFAFTWIFLLSSCKTGIVKEENEKLFTKVNVDNTGVNFSNNLDENEKFNILNYLYFFNGGGVASADLTNDGYPELFFTANMSSDKLYLNKGDFQFEDITLLAGIDTSSEWSTGVNFADVNGDGWQDIYICRVGGGYRGFEGSNKLYIHQGLNENGIPTFRESSKEYGLYFSGFSTQAAFLDYDNDGDLDMYLLNHSVHTERSYGKGDALRKLTDEKAGDKLFKNTLETGKPGFVEVTKEAGILSSQIGYGLGIAVTDFNLDGCPDIYIGNDFHENDYLYINNCDGTFTDQLKKIAGHSSRFTMGVDAADINNDALPDLISLDMKPEFEEILKSSAPEDSYEIYQFKLGYGYYYQFARNNMQLNQGLDQQTGQIKMSEIGQLAGIDATDWSWSSLICDFDNNGYKDIFISNGIFRRPNDMDYLKHISDDNIKRSLNSGITSDNLKVILQMPSVPLANYAFANTSGDSTISFKQVQKDWGLDEKGFSNGALFTDLDNDGDQDLVVNNLNAVASIYRNNSTQPSIKIKLKGNKENFKGLNSKVLIEDNGNTYYQENNPTKGFQSATSHELLFGLGNSTDSIIDRISVFWPNGKYETIENIPYTKQLEFAIQNASSPLTLKSYLEEKQKTQPALFTNSKPTGIDFKHSENKYTDFNAERLMPHLLSTQGPALATGDVNGDGLDDIYFGGAAGQKAKLYIQLNDGSFEELTNPDFQQDRLFEDVDALFFDADNDNDLDLLVASAGNQLEQGKALLQDRLYLNNGRGSFSKSTDALPPINENAATIKSADFDNDGDMDIFIGVRNIPGSYGLSASSYLLENNGKGQFKDVTSEKIPALKEVGMLTDAVWITNNESDFPDLVICGSWMPIRYFENNDGNFTEITDTNGLKPYSGWWQTLTATDIDNDGDIDIIAGNLGLNSSLKASGNQPLQLFVKDLDGNGNTDPIISYYKKSIEGNKQAYTMAGRDELIDQMAYIRKAFPTYSQFSQKKINEIFNAEKRQNSVEKDIQELASAIFINNGHNQFTMQTLPVEAQFSPMYSIIAEDFNCDGKKDLLTAGNFWGVGPALGKYDASFGTLLLNSGTNSFSYLPNRSHGLWLKGECRKMATIQIQGKKIVVATINNDIPQFYEVSKNEITVQ